MKDMMDYRGYYGSVHYSDDDRVFHGKIEFIRGLVSYEGGDVEGLHQAFEEAIDDYIELCAQQGTAPERSFKGTFNVRTGSELHRKAVLFAKIKGTNLNRLVSEALEKYISS